MAGIQFFNSKMLLIESFELVIIQTFEEYLMVSHFLHHTSAAYLNIHFNQYAF